MSQGVCLEVHIFLLSIHPLVRGCQNGVGRLERMYDHAFDFVGMTKNIVDEVGRPSGSFFDCVGSKVDVLVRPFTGNDSLCYVACFVFDVNKYVASGLGRLSSNIGSCSKSFFNNVSHITGQVLQRRPAPPKMIESYSFQFFFVRQHCDLFLMDNMDKPRRLVARPAPTRRDTRLRGTRMGSKFFTSKEGR